MANLLRILAVTAVLVAGATGLAAQDRHSGYYYPEPGSYEVYQSPAEILPQTNRTLRIAFVTGITSQTSNQPYPAPAAIFAKGTEAEKLIIVALEDGRIDTIYRARALFANMTAQARLLPAFQEMGVQDSFNFFDLAKMLGFVQITISDGRDFAHQVTIE